MEEIPDSGDSGVEHAEIVRSLACSNCGYDLRGLRVSGQCPECGQDIWDSVIGEVDPAARRLPLLRNPRGVGNGLLWLMITAVAATLLIAARPVALRIDALGSSIPGAASAWTPPWLLLLAGLILWSGIWSVFKLAPPQGKEPRGAVWTDLRRLLIGLIAAGLVLVGAWLLKDHADSVVVSSINLLLVCCALISLLALRSILGVIGERSRQYRSAQGGRQRVRDMIAAVLGVGAGEMLRIVGAILNQEWPRSLGTVLVWISMLMIVIGLFYLLVNAWWIRRSLVRPPRTLRELVRPVPDRRTDRDQEPGFSS